MNFNKDLLKIMKLALYRAELNQTIAAVEDSLDINNAMNKAKILKKWYKLDVQLDDEYLSIINQSSDPEILKYVYTTLFEIQQTPQDNVANRIQKLMAYIIKTHREKQNITETNDSDFRIYDEF